MSVNGATIKRGLLLLWCMYMLLVLAFNLLDGLQHLGFLTGWRASVNYELVTQAAGSTLGPLLYLGVLVWEAAAAWLLWQAWSRPSRETVFTAFGCCLALWGAFLLADELFLLHALEGVHLRLFTAQLVSLLALALLPD